MKLLKSLTLFAFLAFFTTTIAQTTEYSTLGHTVIGETSLEYDGNPNPAYIVSLEGTHSNLEKSWKNFMKEKYSIKLKKSGSLLIAPDANLADITTKIVTIYSSVNEKSPSSGLILAISIGRDDFISSEKNPQEAEKVKALIKRFVKNYNLEMVNEELEDIQKTYDKMNSELSKVEKESSKMTEDVVDLERDIYEANADITKKKQEIHELEAEISELNTEITTSQNEIDELKRQKDNLQKDIDSQKETVASQKIKLDKIIAKKDLILSE